MITAALLAGLFVAPLSALGDPLSITACPDLDERVLRDLLAAELSATRSPPAVSVRCTPDVRIEARWAPGSSRHQIFAPVTDEPLERTIALIAGQLIRTGPPPLDPPAVTAADRPPTNSGTQITSGPRRFELGLDGRFIANGFDPSLVGGGAGIRVGLRLAPVVVWLGLAFDRGRRNTDEARVITAGGAIAAGVSRAFAIDPRWAVETSLGLAARYEHVEAEPRTADAVGRDASLFLAEPFVRAALLTRVGTTSIGAFAELGVSVPTPRAILDTGDDRLRQLDLGPLRARLGLAFTFAVGGD